MKRYLALIAAVIAIAVISAQLETLPEWVGQIKVSQPYLLNTFLRVHVWQWIGLVIVLCVAILTGGVVAWIAIRLTRIRDHFAPAPIPDATRHSIARSSGIVVGSQFAAVLLNDLALGSTLLTFHSDLHNLLNAVSLLGTVLLIYGCWDVVCDGLASRSVGHQRAERLLVPMIRKLVQAGIVICGLLAAVALFGGAGAIATMAGTLGIGGLVVALAGKDSIENLFGSFTILLDMPFALGDWVKTNGVEGTVEQINLRSTRLRTAEDTVVLLPNANLIRASVENFGSRRFRRAKINFRLSYDSQAEDIEAYFADLQTFLAERSEIVPEMTEIVLTDPQEQSLGMLVDCRLEVKSYADELAARHRIIEEALRLRKKHSIMFAAPPRAKDEDEPAPTDKKVNKQTPG